MVVRSIYVRALVTAATAALVVAIATGPRAEARQTQRPGPPQPSRDTPAQKQDEPTPAGLIAGRVLAADTGRPVKRARVFVSAAELPGGRGVLTDDAGLFQLAELPAGRYTLSVSKSGFVSLSYGQRRPLQAGTPLQLADGQEIKDIEFRLPRGSVIAGHVYDETGDPMPGVLVRVLRYQYQQGDKRLAPAGTAQTDDQGQYRVWGLTPGDYYVDAQSRINLPFGGPAGRGGGGGGRGGGPGGRGGGGGAAAAIAGVVGAIAGGNVAALFGPDDENQKAYAPTYFPGVTSITDAQPITLGLSQTSADVDFNLQLVHVARVSGHVTDPDGTATWSGNVSLVLDSATVGRGGGFGLNYGSRIQYDGTFDISNVPPGRYTLQARGNDNDTPQFASQPLTVGSADIDVSVALADGATISGTIVFPPSQTALPDFSNMRVAAPSTDNMIGGQAQGRVDKDGKFTIGGVQAGAHLIRPGGQLRGWTLKAVTIDGRDVTDTAVELRSGQHLERVEMTLTDKTNEINGTLTGDQGAPVTEYTVLAFSTDSTFWQPQSRHIATARPDQTGHFRIRGLPAGDYYVTTVDPAQQGEWFEPAYLEEHRLGAARVALVDGDTKVQDFKIRTQ
jgi:carboxypeptidase family protein